MTEVKIPSTFAIHRSAPPGDEIESSPIRTDVATPSTPPGKKKISSWTIIGFGFLAMTLIILALTHGTAAGTTLALSFVSIILEALPFVLLGSLLGGLFEVFIPREWIIRLLPERKIYAILVAGALGLLLPVCECALIPFTRRLVRKGVPFSTAVAYLLAGPIVNVLVGSATLMAYGWNWKVLWARMLFGYGVAVGVAFVMDKLFPGHSALSNPTMEGVASCAHGCDHDHDHDHGHDHGHDHDHAHGHAVAHTHDHVHVQAAAHVHAEDGGCCSHSHDDHGHHHAPAAFEPVVPGVAIPGDDVAPRPSRWAQLTEAVNHAGDDFLAVGQFLVLGAFVASICQTMIPRHAFITMASALTDAPPLAIMTMMGLAVVLNLCSGADAFVAASFRSVLPLSAQMGFMVLGPMLDLKLSAMYLSFIKKRAFASLVVLMYSFVFALMVAWHYLAVPTAH